MSYPTANMCLVVVPSVTILKQLCRQEAMKNGKCRFHGGKSTSAKTVQGKMKRDQANLKHGFYTKEAKETRQAMKMVLNELLALY